MTDKAYIVANKQQELDVLNKFEAKELVWLSGDNPTEWVLSENSLFSSRASFPYALVEKENNKISWLSIGKLTDEEIVSDGRKEEKIYKVTQEFINELMKWRDYMSLDTKSDFIDTFVDGQDIQQIPGLVDAWWTDSYDSSENNKRLIAIIQWLNGEDVFEVEEPHKFVVHSKEADEGGHYGYVSAGKHGIAYNRYYLKEATKFNTREEAQEWSNSHQVVVEIDEDGNEVG